MAIVGFQPSRCTFLSSATGPKKGAPEPGLPEVAVAGRSNVGKSSFINFLLGRKGLARTSSTPGRTQLLNFFEVDGRLVVVDLPGYGYARAPQEAVRRWMAGVEWYVRERPVLAGVVLLLDARREPSSDDRAFVELARRAGRPVLAVVTKIDKLPKGQRGRALAVIGEALRFAPDDLVSTSAKEGLGRAVAWRRIIEMVERTVSLEGAGTPTGSARVVAIDGPSGAGKSTVARLLAARLGWTHLDTGAMYRCVGLKAHRSGVPLDDDGALASLCDRTTLAFGRTAGGELQVLLDGEDVSEAIREHRVSELASLVSARKPVRDAMSRFQRQLGLETPSVLEGRDIGTVVFPDALLKVYLTASDDERADRRVQELRARGQAVDRAVVLADLRRRDDNDSSREHAPLRAADDAVVVDTTGQTIDEVVERLAALAGDRQCEEPAFS